MELETKDKIALEISRLRPDECGTMMDDGYEAGFSGYEESGVMGVGAYYGPGCGHPIYCWSARDAERVLSALTALPGGAEWPEIDAALDGLLLEE